MANRSYVDERDREILRILIQDGRAPFKDIGEEIGVSDVTVKNRIEKMVENGVIEQFTVDIDQARVGKPLLVTIGVKVDPRMIDDAIERLSDIEEFYSIWKTTGAHNLSIRSCFDDTEHMNDVIDSALNVYGIREYHLSILAKEVKGTKYVL